MKNLRCTNCGLLLIYPESYNGTSTCNYCNKFNRKTFKGESALIQKLDSESLFAVTVSGGKDSLYVWNWAVSTFGPEKVIAFNHHKTNAVDPLAIQNIASASKILNSKVVYINDDTFFPRFLRNLKTYIHNPNPAILRAVICAGCRFGISHLIFEECKKYDIQKVVNGSSYLELAPFKGHAMKSLGNGNETRGLLNGLSACDDYLTQDNLSTIIQDHFNCHAAHLSNKKNIDGIEYIDFFDYLENKPNEIRETAISKLDWKHPDNQTWHFDCVVENFKQLFYYLAYGYTELDYKYSEMVRYGLLTRDDAIRQLNLQIENMIFNVPQLRRQLIEWNVDPETIEEFDQLCVPLSYLKYV